jgi:hypothetical protein
MAFTFIRFELQVNDLRVEPPLPLCVRCLFSSRRQYVGQTVSSLSGGPELPRKRLRKRLRKRFS